MKIGIIGIGIAGQLHSKVMEILDKDIEYYVYDAMMNVAQEFAKVHKCQTINTIEELYKKTDAVIIATPTFTHYDLVMEALQKGKHVLCEKPMAVHLSEAEKMLEISRKKNKICAIGFNYRFFEITEILRSQNQIGEMCSIKVLIKRLFRDDWHTKDNGVLADLGIHLIDYITYLSNQNINLPTCKVKRKYIEGWDYNSKVLGKTERGISFELTASRTKSLNEVQFNIEIIGTKGTFRYDSRKETTYLIEKNNISCKYNFKKKQTTKDFFDFTDSILKQDMAWIKAISNKNIKNIATFEDGFRAQKALEFFLSKK